ncbi:hypothetical protein B0H14DRAFT_2635378 [Mycena olivaceomarginata]|nr:hypothetical protein B0H14DRAFT_2635378 [Mycena olivaceomarginata]
MCEGKPFCLKPLKRARTAGGKSWKRQGQRRGINGEERKRISGGAICNQLDVGGSPQAFMRAARPPKIDATVTAAMDPSVGRLWAASSPKCHIGPSSNNKIEAELPIFGCRLSSWNIAFVCAFISLRRIAMWILSSSVPSAIPPAIIAKSPCFTICTQAPPKMHRHLTIFKPTFLVEFPFGSTARHNDQSGPRDGARMIMNDGRKRQKIDKGALCTLDSRFTTLVQTTQAIKSQENRRAVIIFQSISRQTARASEIRAPSRLWTECCGDSDSDNVHPGTAGSASAFILTTIYFHSWSVHATNSPEVFGLSRWVGNFVGTSFAATFTSRKNVVLNEWESE